MLAAEIVYNLKLITNITGMNMRKQEIALLMCFDAIAMSGSVSRAAQQMRITQPAMSNALANLRAMFSDPLFVRTRKGMSPTPKAMELMPIVRQALAGMQNALLRAGRYDPQTSRVLLTVTATDYGNFVLMPKLAPYLETQAPELDLDIRVPDREFQDEWLERGEVDFRIGWVGRPAGNLRFRMLFTDKLVCLVRRDHPVVGTRLTTEQYCTLPHVRTEAHKYTEFTESGPIIDGAVAALGHRLRIAVRSPDYLSVPFIVAQSNLIATVPRRLALPFVKILPLRIMRVPVLLPDIRISLFWHERTHNSSCHKRFRSILGKLTAEL